MPLPLQLPVTLLYDHQSVDAVVEFINEALKSAGQQGEANLAGGADGAHPPAGDSDDSEAEDITGAAQRQPRSAGAASSDADGDRPSALLKTLRPPAAERPLFLAAPGVANAQSAYFSFSQFLQVGGVDLTAVEAAGQGFFSNACKVFETQRADADGGGTALRTSLLQGPRCACVTVRSRFPHRRKLVFLPPPDPPLQPVQWSSQPIYVLDKDNDLDVPALARRNAADMVRVQPEGPYLVGGHSYGGAVAMEIAMVLEGWGHTVGLVLVSRRGKAGGAAGSE